MSTDLAYAYIHVGLIGVGLIALTAVACLAPVLVRVFVFAQVVYWSFSFILRSVLLLTTLPVPQFADSIADPRLADSGYAYAITEVLKPISISIWLYIAVLLIFIGIRQRYLINRARTPRGITTALTTPFQRNTNMLPTFVTAYVIGSLARGASYVTGSVGQAGDVSSSNPYLDLIGSLAGISGLVIIVYYRHQRPTVPALVVGALMAGELVWGIISESKTPLLAAALAVAVRFAVIGFTRAKVLSTALGAVVLVGIFGWLQSFKVSSATAQASDAAGAAYPAWSRSILSIVNRFDLLQASTDVWFFRGKTWITATDVVKNMVFDLIPTQLGVTKFQSGTEWAKTVRGSSVDLSQVSVSLAEGHLNEGYLIGGFPGVIAESVMVVGMIFTVAALLRSRFIPLICVGISFIAFPALFERGVLGIAETLGKALQSGIAIGVLSLIVGWVLRRLSRPPAFSLHDYSSPLPLPALADRSVL